MKKILFVCVENSARSQMAEGFARHYSKGKIVAYSAGSKPAEGVNPLAVQVMKEVGIDLSRGKPKGFDSLPTQEFDYVVTMGCQDICPIVPAKEHIAWEIEDPKGKGIEFFKRTRDQIEKYVRDLLDEIAKEDCART
ncbi:MAG: arsenate reductase ArsC [bacterium]